MFRYSLPWKMTTAAAKVSLVPRPFGKIEKGSCNTGIYNALSQRNSISHATTHYMFMYIFGQSVCSCMACVIDHSADTNYISSLWPCGSEALAFLMNEDCCHDTAASNVYITAWQEIVKPKAIELCVSLSAHLLATVGPEQSDRPR